MWLPSTVSQKNRDREWGEVEMEERKACTVFDQWGAESHQDVMETLVFFQLRRGQMEEN